MHAALASKHQKNATQLVTQRGAAIVFYEQGTSNARSLRHATTTLEKRGDLALRTLLALAGEEMPEPPTTNPETAAAVTLRECATALTFFIIASVSSQHGLKRRPKDGDGGGSGGGRNAEA